MLEASSKIDEARKQLDPPKQNDDEGGEDFQILRGMAKSDLDNLLNLDQDIDPIDLETRVSMLNADQKRVYDIVSSHKLHLSRHEGWNVIVH